MAAIQQISSLSSGRIKTYSFSAVSLEHHRLFSLEKKRSNVKDSDNRDFHIIVLILTLTHTPEEARSANVVSTEGEMFIVADTECFLSIVYGWRYYLCAEGIIYVSYSYVHTSTFVCTGPRWSSMYPSYIFAKPGGWRRFSP